MTDFETQRIRDPVHGLIVFQKGKPVDELAWRLLDTPEFQRLRRIKQLGVSEFVFPGATHSRFAHSVGVFHTARQLLEILRREIDAIGQAYDKRRGNVAVIAALLHDLGHGPFSHTFEGVQRQLGIRKRHEMWTADIIRNLSGHLKLLLEAFWTDGSFCEAVATLLESEDPKDIYHAIVSSSFDADRLDYLRRDRMMTGTGAGAIDFDWLMEHIRVADVRLDAADEDAEPVGTGSDASPHAPTFCIHSKALPAAEQFLLSRYTLHEQVYFHKTTRCIEHMIAQLLQKVSEQASRPAQVTKQTGLGKTHPLVRFFTRGGATLENYLALDDLVIMGAIERMTEAQDLSIADLASRLRDRRLFKTLDVARFGPDTGIQRSWARKIDKQRADGKFSGLVLKDEGASLSIYSQVGGDDEKAHKKLRILDNDNRPREISSRSRVIPQLTEKRQLTRYYFQNKQDRALARGDAQGAE